MDWQTLFVPTMSLSEAAVRGSVTFLALYAFLRLTLRRNIGSLSITDLLMMVITGNAVTNSLAGGDNSITGGLMVGAIVILWNFAMEWSSARFQAIERWTQPAPVPLVREGEIQWRSMRREMVSEQELMAKIRERGILDLSKVKLAQVEPDGRISVIAD